VKTVVTGELVVKMGENNVILTITEHAVIIRDERRALNGSRRERYFGLINAVGNKFTDVLDSLNELTRG